MSWIESCEIKAIMIAAWESIEADRILGGTFFNSSSSHPSISPLSKCHWLTVISFLATKSVFCANSWQQRCHFVFDSIQIKTNAQSPSSDCYVPPHSITRVGQSRTQAASLRPQNKDSIENSFLRHGHCNLFFPAVSLSPWKGNAHSTLGASWRPNFL